MNEDVSKKDILLAIAELSNKFNSFGRNIIALVENKVPEIEKDGLEQVNDTEQINGETLCSEDICGVSNDVKIDVLEVEDPSNEPAIPRLLLLVDRKTILSHIFGAVGWMKFGYPTYCINVSKPNTVKKSKSRLLPIAGKFWFMEDKSDYFKPFKELSQQLS